MEWGIEADAQRLLLANSAAAAAAGGDDVEAGGGGLPLEEAEVATLRACGLVDGAELLLTLQDAAQGAARRELRCHWPKELRKGSVVKHEGRVGVVALVVSIDEPGDHRYCQYDENNRYDPIVDDPPEWVLKPGTENTVRLYWEDGRQMSGYVDKDKLYPPSSEDASVPWVVARQKRLRIIEGCTNCCHVIGNCLLWCMILGGIMWLILRDDDSSSGSGDQF